MCSEDIQQEILTALRGIEQRLNSDEYENLGSFVLGGSTGTYTVHSPTNTECEWSLFAAFSLGAAANGVIAVSASNNNLANLATAIPTFGLQSNGADSNAFEGYFIQCTTTGFMPFEYWLPLGRGASITASVNATSGNTYAIICFRRKLDRVIPDKPRQKPHSHTPLSRRALRALPAQSQMAAGFEAQYPHDGVPYQHVGIPAQQDTAVARRGIFPMGRSNKNAGR